MCREVKALKRRSRRETESEEGVAAVRLPEWHVADPKPGDLVTGRLKPG